MENKFQSVAVPEGCTLRRKEQFDYTTLYNQYAIELFFNQDGTCYAVAVPNSGRLIVYGSSIVKDPQQALQMVIDKIEREGLEEKDATRDA